MLNYFLQHLVGPKMGALKVKDFSEFDFKPQQLVSDICTIYLNLGYVVNTKHIFLFSVVILLVLYPLKKKYSGTLLSVQFICKYNFVSVFGSDEENFCATVPKDGRSYSAALFSQTVRVLKKINKPGDMIVAFGLLADKIKVSFVLQGSPRSWKNYCPIPSH